MFEREVLLLAIEVAAVALKKKKCNYFFPFLASFFVKNSFLRSEVKKRPAVDPKIVPQIKSPVDREEPKEKLVRS